MRAYKTYILVLALMMLLPVAVGVSVACGTKYIDIGQVYEAFMAFDGTNVDHQIIIHSRLPRGMGALLIGSALAISGALMQGITQNPLASPGLMGVSDGSALAVTVSMIFFPTTSMIHQMIFSFIGSAFGAMLVFGLGAYMRNGLSPATLAILGSVIGTFLGGVAVVLNMYFQNSQDISFWYNARLHQIQPDHLQIAAIFITAGTAIALYIGKGVTILSLGKEVAISLGQRIVYVKLMAAFAVILLTGSAVALAGKIGFVGLIIPHIACFLVGSHYSRIIPISALLGGIGLVLADVVSRFLNYPFETPIGVITSLVGVPFFLYLARSKGGRQGV